MLVCWRAVVAPRISSFAAGAAALLAYVALSACGGASQPVVARVNGAPDGTITQSTLNHWVTIGVRTERLINATAPDPPGFQRCAEARLAVLRHLHQAPGTRSPHLTLGQLRKQCAADYQLLRKQTLTFLIEAIWLNQQAAHDGVRLSPSEIAARRVAEEQQLGIKGSAGLERYLSYAGMTRADFNYRVRVYALADKLNTAASSAGVTPPTRSEVAGYFRSHAAQLVSPQRRDLLLIATVRRDNAVIALRLLRSGESFGKVARALSIDPVTRAKGGRYDGYLAGQFRDPAIDAAVSMARVGALTGPLHSTRGYFLLFEVTRVIPSRRLTLSQAEATIRASLEQRQASRLLARFRGRLQATWKPRTRCIAGLLVTDCGGPISK